MSSLITVSSSEGENMLPEMGELSGFHPDQLSNLVDIQEELDKLVAQEEADMDMSMSTVDDVDVVGHEVTIGEDQEDTEMDIPDMQDMEVMESQHKEISELLVDNLDIAQTVTIEAPPPSKETKKKMGRPVNPKPMPVTQLKTIRPFPEVLKQKRPTFNISNVKKNVLTKVIFAPNTQSNVTSHSPILIGGEPGSQTIRIVGQKGFINSPRTITLAQAREMGLKLSPGKVQQIIPNQQKVVQNVVRQNLVMDPSKTYAMVRSPTKILPLPTSGQLQQISPLPQRFIIRPASGIKTSFTTNSTFLTNAMSSSSSQILRFGTPTVQDNHTSQIHQIQLPGQKVQYVRLVTSSASAVNNTAQSVALTTVEEPPPPPPPPVIPSPTPPPAPDVQITNAQPKLLHLAPNPTTTATAAQNTNNFERVLVSTTNNNGTSNKVVMVPSEFIKNYKPPPDPVLSPTPPPPPIKPAPAPAPAPTPAAPLLTKAKEVAAPTIKDFIIPITHRKSTEPPNGLRPRKPCNCTKSQCLKLYCDCFANGEFCFQCNCNCCYNNLDHEEDRQRAIKACLERNPSAFRPKIGKGYVGDERRHNKGCNCKRSGCLKNYCECYEAKIPCSNNCKCIGCRNVEDPRDNDRTRPSLQNSLKSKLSSEIQESASRSNTFTANQGTRQPFNLMTQEVVEATCQCLLAVEGDTKSQVSEHVERLILEEFGRCLVQIIDCANRTSVNTNT